MTGPRAMPAGSAGDGPRCARVREARTVRQIMAVDDPEQARCPPRRRPSACLRRGLSWRQGARRTGRAADLQPLHKNFTTEAVLVAAKSSVPDTSKDRRSSGSLNCCAAFTAGSSVERQPRPLRAEQSLW